VSYRAWISLVLVALAGSGLLAVASGAPTWLLVVGAVGGAAAGIWGGRLVLRLLADADASDSVVDLRTPDDPAG